MVTVYDHSDFYFSTNDPAVPPFVESITISSDLKGAVPIPGVNLSTDFFTKLYEVKVPEGHGAVIWEATANGDSYWRAQYDANTRMLKIPLNIKKNLPTTATNWIGIRVRLLDTPGLVINTPSPRYREWGK